MKHCVWLEGVFEDKRGLFHTNFETVLLGSPPEGVILPTLATWPVEKTILKLRIGKGFFRVSVEIVFKGIVRLCSYRDTNIPVGEGVPVAGVGSIDADA